MAARSFPLSGVCGIPASAAALSLNVTITRPTAAGDLRLYPADATNPPLISIITFSAGQTRANNALLALPANGSGVLDAKVDSSGTVDLILDLNGYFQ